jgi:hypothetical protein
MICAPEDLRSEGIPSAGSSKQIVSCWLKWVRPTRWYIGKMPRLRGKNRRRKGESYQMDSQCTPKKEKIKSPPVAL